LTKCASQRSRHIELNDLVVKPSVATHFQSWRVISAPRALGFVNTTTLSKYPTVERHFVWKTQTRDAEGNKIGPVVTKPDLNAMLAMKSMGEVDRFITNNLNAPDINNEWVVDFIDAVQKYRIVAFQNANNLRERKTASTIAFRRKRLKNVHAMIRKLKSEAPESLINLLAYFRNPRYLKFDRYKIWCPHEKYCIQFNNVYVHIYMRQFITSPVSVLNSRLKREEIIAELASLVGYDGPPPM